MATIRPKAPLTKPLRPFSLDTSCEGNRLQFAAAEMPTPELISKVNKRIDLLNLCKVTEGHAIRRKDGTIVRIARICSDGQIQTTKSEGFYLSEGNVSYSGGLDYPERFNLKATAERASCQFWVFRGLPAAHTGVYFKADTRLWLEV